MSKGQKIFIGVVVALVAAALIVWGIASYRKGKQDEANKTVTGAAGGTGNNTGNGGTDTAGNAINNAQQAAQNGAAALPDQTGSVVYRGLPDGDFPLKLGAKSKLVHLLQHLLNVLHKAGLTEDGQYGSSTDAAVKKYWNGLAEVNKVQARNIYLAIPGEWASSFSGYGPLIQNKILK